MAQTLLIGIDGGGTHSTAVAAYPDGRIAAVCQGGGLNFHNVGVKAVREHMESMVTALCDSCGGTAGEICVGMSALDAPADERTTALFTGGVIPPGRLDLQSDASIALMGFTQGKPGVIVICGTGSMLLMLDGQGRQHVAGGWGYLLNDAGSGYTLAREGLLAAIDHAEGLGDETALLPEALAFFGADAPRGLIDRVYSPGMTPDRFAGFARCVLASAEKGDKPAYDLLKRNMAALAKRAAHLAAQAEEVDQVGLYGGIFAHSALARQLFTESMAGFSPALKVKRPEYPPELGALIHLYRKNGGLNDEVLSRMKSSYKEVSL